MHFASVNQCDLNFVNKKDADFVPLYDTGHLIVYGTQCKLKQFHRLKNPISENKITLKFHWKLLWLIQVRDDIFHDNFGWRTKCLF